MSHVSVVPYLEDYDGTFMGAFPKDIYWSTEELRNSTNRLSLEVPASFSLGASVDKYIIFRNRRFIIVETHRSRDSDIIEIQADEAQVVLTTSMLVEYAPEGIPLRDAVELALEGSKWSVGEVAEDTYNYSASLTQTTRMHCLRFLESQSRKLLDFDSINYTVNMVAHDEDAPLDRQFRYGKNLASISKTDNAPEATVLYPYGRDGVSIASVNDGEEFIEDFSWYIGLGLTEKEARERYTKEDIWVNENFVIPGNLLRAAQKRLARSAHPAINYKITGAILDDTLRLGDECYVVDEELGIRIRTEVVRLVRTKDGIGDTVELDYMVNTLGVGGEDVADATDQVAKEANFVRTNEDDFQLTEDFVDIFRIDIAVIGSTFFHINLASVIKSESVGLIEGFFQIDGVHVGIDFAQTVMAGYHTIGIPVVVDGIEPGMHGLRLFMRASNRAILPANKTMFAVRTTAALMSAGQDLGPDRTIIETIPVLPSKVLSPIQDNIRVDLRNPITSINREDVALPKKVVSVSDKADYTFQPISKTGPKEEDD